MRRVLETWFGQCWWPLTSIPSNLNFITGTKASSTALGRNRRDKNHQWIWDKAAWFGRTWAETTVNMSQVCVCVWVLRLTAALLNMSVDLQLYNRRCCKFNKANLKPLMSQFGAINSSFKRPSLIHTQLKHFTCNTSVEDANFITISDESQHTASQHQEMMTKLLKQFIIISYSNKCELTKGVPE